MFTLDHTSQLIPYNSSPVIQCGCYFFGIGQKWGLIIPLLFDLSYLLEKEGGVNIKISHLVIFAY